MDAVHEVGCIHTLQGYDLNYGFVILGPDIYYDEKVHQVKARKSSLFDSVSKRGASDEEIAQIVVNAYYVLMTRGMLGTFLYVCDPALKRYLSHYITMIERCRKKKPKSKFRLLDENLHPVKRETERATKSIEMKLR